MWSCDKSLVISISMREVIITSILKIFPEIQIFLRGTIGSSSVNSSNRYGFEILHHCGERVKTESQ